MILGRLEYNEHNNIRTMGGTCMGSYLNPGSKGFQESLNSEIYVDKSGLIEKTNAVINTRQKFICVSRPRRFGKSMAADMLAAYYDRGEDQHRHVQQRYDHFLL